MVEKLEDVWFSRDLPVLVEVTRQIDGGGSIIDEDAVATALGIHVSEVRKSFKALERRGLVVTDGAMSGRLWVEQLDGDAYVLTGLHPDGDDIVDRLVSALRQAADQTDDEDEQSGLRKAARGLGEVSRGVAVGVISAALTGYLPGQ